MWYPEDWIFTLTSYLRLQYMITHAWRKKLIYNVQNDDSTFITTTLLAWLYARVDILLACGKHLHDRIISLREDVWSTKLIWPRHFLLKFLKSCIYVLYDIDSACFYDFPIGFRNCSDSVQFVYFYLIYA